MSLDLHDFGNDLAGDNFDLFHSRDERDFDVAPVGAARAHAGIALTMFSISLERQQIAHTTQHCDTLKRPGRNQQHRTEPGYTFKIMVKRV
eukprot:9206518-Karenia_brevis.AAC.1